MYPRMLSTDPGGQQLRQGPGEPENIKLSFSLVFSAHRAHSFNVSNCRFIFLHQIVLLYSGDGSNLVSLFNRAG